MNLSNSYSSSGCRYVSNDEIASFIIGHTLWIDNLVQNDWKAYYVSVLFHPLNGNRQSQLEQMKREIRRLYSRFATKTVKNTHSPTWKRYLPVAIFVPDLPVAKYKGQTKITIADASINDGLHMNGIIVTNRWGRVRVGLKKHFREERKRYVARTIRDIGVTLIKDDLPTVVDYTFKCVKRRAFSVDDVILLDWGGSSKVSGVEETARKELGLDSRCLAKAHSIWLETSNWSRQSPFTRERIARSNGLWSGLSWISHQRKTFKGQPHHMHAS